MSCIHWANSVKKGFLKHPEVVVAEVNLDENTATVELARDMPIEELQQTVSPDGIYIISEASEHA